MLTFKKLFKKKLSLSIFSVLLFSNYTVMAGTDFDARESYLKARAATHGQDMSHENHAIHIDKSLDFHGVFYGYLPCSDCNGIKNTLSLKQKNNYLLVTQPARDSSKEYYEKGKYDWNEEKRLLVLTPRNPELKAKYYTIADEGTLIQLDENGKSMPRNLIDGYTLRRSDVAKSREVHIH
ncbi:MAG: copper resistance protein NlpE [Methylococcaceae bacterium]